MRPRTPETSFEDYLNNKLKHNKRLLRKYDEELHRLEVALKVIALREQKKVTQQEMAKILHTSQSAVARLESGRANITIDSLYRIAAAFDKKLRVSFV